MAGLLKIFVRNAVHDWIREDAPVSIKMTLTKPLCEKLVDRIAASIQKQANEN